MGESDIRPSNTTDACHLVSRYNNIYPSEDKEVFDAVLLGIGVDKDKLCESLCENKSPRASTGLQLSLKCFCRKPSNDWLDHIVTLWSPLGTDRRSLEEELEGKVSEAEKDLFPMTDSTEQGKHHFRDEFQKLKSQTKGNIVLAMDLEWKRLDSTTIPLEVGFSLLDTITMHQKVGHHAIKDDGLRSDHYRGSKPPPARSFMHGRTVEHESQASFVCAVHAFIREVEIAASRNGQKMILVFWDCTQDKKILKTHFDLDLEDYSFGDLSNAWSDIEHIKNRRSLEAAVRWTTGKSFENEAHNAGNDAHAVVEVFKNLILPHDDVSSACWSVFGAVSIADIPAESVVRSPDGPQRVFGQNQG